MKSWWLAASLPLMFAAGAADAQGRSGLDAEKARVVNYWTAERRAAAVPRDLIIDERGLGYLRGRDGSLKPYGHQIEAANAPTPRAKPDGTGGNSDSEPPAISNLDPANETIGASSPFSATVTDNEGVRSVTFVITYPDGVTTQSFSASNQGGDSWGTSLQGFTDGSWSWHVEAADTAKRGGNRSVSDPVNFTVDTGGSGGGGGGGSGDVVTNAGWSGGTVQRAAGRLFYEMPGNARRKGPWSGYVCSGTVVVDGQTGIATILTAAHCVYDDVNKAFARNVLFIPDQAGTSGSGTDSNCGNDPIGCWVASYGVVDVDWTTRTFPDNIEWDSAYYVVQDGAHQQGEAGDLTSGVLDIDVDPMTIEFMSPSLGVLTHALGYSYSEDPNFMYCAEDMSEEGAVNWWLANCGLSGGSSGGPWVQPMDEEAGDGPIISVNSWGYNGAPGMAGPKLSDGAHECVYKEAVLGTGPTNAADGDAGVITTAKSCGQQ